MIIFSSNEKDNSNVFHVTLANPEVYTDGKYEKTIELIEGSYSFHFVPNGDSPRILSITLNGSDFYFTEDFVLNGTSHKTGFSEYYTWDYIGKKNIILTKKTELKITIDPNGDTIGPVSVDILKE